MLLQGTSDHSVLVKAYVGSHLHSSTKYEFQEEERKPHLEDNSSTDFKYFRADCVSADSE